ncbi:MAG: TonB-dependent receptor plug domain-containing protein [Gemmatimonadetes bacterium]|nr:TonB-dependent receptor plug domain-containing protein [Gemmatimonadota bacterium]
MRILTRTNLLVLILALVQACGGSSAPPTADPAGADDSRRGYAGQPENPTAGAVQSLESEEESGGTFVTMVDMLRGRVAGLEITETAGGQISIRIRGDQSLYHNKEPLLVVDGMPIPPYSFSNTLRTMNPRDVESIQVLKDAGSTSSYGIRGAHGVILIRLKRG